MWDRILILADRDSRLDLLWQVPFGILAGFAALLGTFLIWCAGMAGIVLVLMGVKALLDLL